MHAYKRISVVIPIHNGENFINGLINNLICFRERLSENKIDIQIIIIIDGSNDGSEKILINFQKKLNLILLKNESKKGPSYSRNLGINYANGDYLLFLDVDDNLVINGFDDLLKDIDTDSDILIGDYFIRTESTTDLRRHNMPIEIGKNYLSFEFINNYLINYMLEPYKYTLFVHCWCKLYKINFLKINNIKFNEKIDQLEDVNFNFKCIKFKPKVFYLNKPIYSYTRNSNDKNLSKKSGSQRDAIKNVLKALYIIKIILKNTDFQLYRKYRYHLYATTFILWIIRSSRESSSLSSKYKVFTTYCANKYVRISMKYYIKLTSNDHTLPSLIIYNLPSIALAYCKLAK